MPGVLIERQAQLRVLHAALDDAREGTGSTVLISGEPGIGKTSVVRAFVSAIASATRVLSGACEDLLSPRALGAIRDASAAVPGPLATAIAGRAGPDEVFAAAVDELRRKPIPTVLVVEDVHWADSATLDVIRHLARRVGELPALLVLSYRDVPVDHPLRNVIGALSSASAHRLPLARLSPEGVAELARDCQVDLDALVGLTDGNPFFVTEVLAAPDQTVPPTVADAVLARVGKLSPATRAALEPLAVVPQGLAMQVLGELVGGPSPLEEAEQAGVVRLDGTVVRFRHELARRAVFESLTASTRLSRHREVLRAFEHRGGVDPSQLLHHAVGAHDDEAVIRWGLAAAREAGRVGAHRQAVACYEQVVARQVHLSPDQTARLYEVYSWALSHANRFFAAAEAADNAVQRWREVGDAAHLVRPLVALTRQQWITGNCRAAVETAGEALAIARANGEDRLLALALVCRGGVQVLTDAEIAGLPLLAEGLILADRLEERDIAALTRNYIGSAQLQLGHHEGEVELQRSVEIARATGNHEFVMRGYYNLAEGMWRLGHYDTAIDYVDRGERYSRDRDFPAHDYFFRARRLRLQAMRGEWGPAEVGLRALLAGPEHPGMIGRETIPILARLLVRRGDAEAMSWLERSATWARRTEVLEWFVPTGMAWLEYAWLTDRTSLAQPWTELLFTATERDGCDLMRAELLRWQARLRSPTQLQAYSAAPQAYSAAPETYSAAPEEAYSAGLAGDWAAAAALWEQARQPYQQALELLESNQEQPTVRALEIFNELDAAPAARLARRRLHALGVTRIPRRRERRSNPAGLTDRQLEILRLVADGLSNPQIAERLVISARTVDHHVSATLRQLGVGSRGEAAQLLQSWQ